MKSKQQRDLHSKSYQSFKMVKGINPMQMVLTRANRCIFHVDMDAFFVSVEQTLNPHLKGKPVVVGGNPKGRGVVAAASYEARKYGIHSAMPVARAQRLCPSAIFVKGHYQEYQRVSKIIKSIFLDTTPAVEMVSIDEAYLDMTGFERLYGPMLNTAERLRARILRETGCSASIGIGANKLVAKVASEAAKPAGLLMIKAGCEHAYFSHLSIEKIPGIGKAATHKLNSLGIFKVKDITRIGVEVLKLAMGKHGEWLYHKSLGLGSETLSKPQCPKSISNEKTFQHDTVDREYIASVLSYLTEKAMSRMRGHGLKAKRVSLKLRYSDFHTITRDYTFTTYTDVDHEVKRVVHHLFRKAFTRRTRIRLLGVALSRFHAGPEQLSLPGFDPANRDKWQSALHSIDGIREKYGFRTIVTAKAWQSRKPHTHA